MTRWEYATVYDERGDLWHVHVNRLGAEGWEMVGVSGRVAYFKRPLAEGSEEGGDK